MKNELVQSAHAVGESNFHLQLTPAYRRDIFINEEVQQYILAYSYEKLAKLKVTVLAADFGPDHFHIFVTNVRHVSEIKLVRQLKGYTSYMMRHNHQHPLKGKLWGKKFWSYGHFYRSVGAVNKETVKRYVQECQEKHWTKQTLQDKNQKTLANFAG